ncbi:MAG: hypothetical protein ABIA11_04295 [Patescibacteria group bacterium]
MYKHLYTIGAEALLDPHEDTAIKGKGWEFEFADILDDSEYEIVYGTNTDANGKKTTVKAKQLLLKTNSETLGNEVFELFNQALDIVQGYLNPLFGSYLEIAEINEVGKGFTIPPGRKTKYIQTYNPAVYKAAKITAKASYKDTYKFALSKVFQSIELFSIPAIDLDPFHNENIFIPTLNTKLPSTVVLRLTQSIRLAYSAIEELGLHLQAKDKIKDKAYATIESRWLPKSKTHLEKRLSSVAKINPTDTYLWMRRGPKQTNEMTRKTKGVKDAPWVSGEDVRDEEVLFIDAIADARYLSSDISGHTLGSKGKEDKLATLSPYDVLNVQHLSRELLMRTLKEWKSHNP